MRLKKRRTSKDVCIFIGLFLVIFVTIFHVLLFGHSKAVAYSDKNTSDKNTHVNRNIRTASAVIAENVARNALSEAVAQGGTAQDILEGMHTNQKQVQLHLDTPRKASIRHHHAVISSSRARMRALAQAELRKMEKSLTALVRQNAPSPEVSANKYRSETSAFHFKQMIHQSEDRLSHNSHNSNRTDLYNETGPVGRSLQQNSSSTTHTNNKNENEHRFKFSSELDQQPHVPNNNNDDSAGGGMHHFKEFDAASSYDLSKTIMESLESPDKSPPANEEISSDHVWNLTRAHTSEDSGDQKKLCGAVSPRLEGVTRDVHLDIEVDIEDIIKSNADVEAGGEWQPPYCVSRHRLAIIIPYRDRWSHLKVLLHYLLPLLKRQEIHFRIFVVEQHGNKTFNKGRIMNAAYREALKLFDFHCVIFHDVDLVPEDDRNIYTCTEHPKHMSTAIDKFNYHLPYQGLVGGVLCFRVDHFQLVNGYSNMYWGWGGEDDDMTTRILSKGLRIFRPPNNVARYKMVKHSGRSASQIRLKLLRTAARRGRVEGLNNVPYHLIFVHNEKLFTHFMVDVGEP